MADAETVTGWTLTVGNDTHQVAVEVDRATPGLVVRGRFTFTAPHLGYELRNPRGTVIHRGDARGTVVNGAARLDDGDTVTWTDPTWTLS